MKFQHLFSERFVIVSEPQWRDIFTKILSPRLASQAPNVNRIKEVDGDEVVIKTRTEGVYTTIDNIIPSRHSKDIRKCFLFMINVIVINKKASRGKIIMDSM